MQNINPCFPKWSGKDRWVMNDMISYLREITSAGDSCETHVGFTGTVLKGHFILPSGIMRMKRDNVWKLLSRCIIGGHDQDEESSAL